MESDKGLEIQVELKRKKKTQRWLLDELQKRGYTNVNEKLLSHILNGRYPWRLGREVLAISHEILKQNREAV